MPSTPEPVWIDTPGALNEVCGELVASGRFAIDTEFHRERTYFAVLALVQVAWPGHVALIDPLAVDVAPLAEPLARSHVVLHAGDQDLDILRRACGVVPEEVVDTQLVAGFLGWSSPSLGALVEAVLGHSLVKGDRLTDWTRRPLREAQRIYAADDVAHLLALDDELGRRLRERGREQWAADECRQLRDRVAQQPDPQQAWWRVKECRSLRGERRAIAQAVAAWREDRAARVDKPVRTVLPDLALAGIAQRPPRNRGDLNQVRGLDSRFLRDGAAEELLAAVERGRAMSEDEIRIPPSGDVERDLRPALTLATAWISQLARELQLDPALLATRADLVSLLSREPGSRLGQGWRKELAGEAVRMLVDGEVAVAFSPRQGELVMEERSGRLLAIPGQPGAPEAGISPSSRGS